MKPVPFNEGSLFAACEVPRLPAKCAVYRCSPEAGYLPVIEKKAMPPDQRDDKYESTGSALTDSSKVETSARGRPTTLK